GTASAAIHRASACARRGGGWVGRRSLKLLLRKDYGPKESLRFPTPALSGSGSGVDALNVSQPVTTSTPAAGESISNAECRMQNSEWLRFNSAFCILHSAFRPPSISGGRPARLFVT